MPNDTPTRRAYPIDWAPQLVYIVRAEDRSVLYVGMTGNIHARMAEHHRKSDWWLAADSIEVEEFQTRDEAARRESRLVRTLSPVHNRWLQVGERAERVRAASNLHDCMYAAHGCENLTTHMYCPRCFEFGFKGRRPGSQHKVGSSQGYAANQMW